MATITDLTRSNQPLQAIANRNCEEDITRRDLDVFFKPKSVAVIGATEREGHVGRSVLWNLISSPFGGTVYPVNAKRASILGVESVPRADTDKYGIVAVEADRSVTSRVRSIVEKPKPAVAPSNLAVVGRYVLAPAIFEHLERIGHGAGGEIQLTDGIASLMREEAVYAYRFEGKRYDCGSKLGYLQATVEYALGHPALGREFRRYLQGLDIAAAAQAPTAARAAAGPAGAAKARANGGARRQPAAAKTPLRAGSRRRSTPGARAS